MNVEKETVERKIDRETWRKKRSKRQRMGAKESSQRKKDSELRRRVGRRRRNTFEVRALICNRLHMRAMAAEQYDHR